MDIVSVLLFLFAFIVSSLVIGTIPALFELALVDEFIQKLQKKNRNKNKPSIFSVDTITWKKGIIIFVLAAINYLLIMNYFVPAAHNQCKELGLPPGCNSAGP